MTAVRKYLTPGNLLAFFLLPSIAGLLLIAKVFLLPHCGPFDGIDDANHTFVNLFVSRSILRDGEIPMMNLFNNFGTPILGDPLTYPFSIHSLTYAFFPDAVAMGVNRFALAFLSVAALTVYFRRSMSAFSASLCALLVLWNPAVLWHFAHHYYQAAVLFFALILLIQERFFRMGGARNFFLLYGTLILFVLSTSIHLVLIFMVSLVVNAFFIPAEDRRRKMILLAAAAGGAFLFSYPMVLSFFQMLPLVSRVDAHYAAALPISFRDILLNVVGQFGEGHRSHHLDVFAYLSLPVLAMVVLGLVAMFRSAADRRPAWRVVVLGLAPFAGIVFLLCFRNIWWSVPLLKGTDITRFVWISCIFLMMAAGRGLDSIRSQPWSVKGAALIATVTAAVLAGYYVIGLGGMPLVYRLPAWCFLVLVWLYLFLSLRPGRADTAQGARAPVKKNIFLLFGLLMIAAHLPSVARITGTFNLSDCRTSHYYSYIYDAAFEPDGFLPHMQPYSRIATELPTHRGQDLKAARYHLFGGMGRGPLVHRAFADYLAENKFVIVHEEPVAYYFSRPWDPEAMSRFGIRYLLVMMPSKRIYQDGWQFKATYEGFLSLFENPLKTSLLYLLDKENRTPLANESIRFKGNGMTAVLPALEGPRQLIATFVAWPWWKAFVDGKPRPIFHGKDQLIRLRVGPGDKNVSIRYAPYEWWHFAGGVAGSLILAIGTFWIVNKRRPRMPGGGIADSAQGETR